jgi:hypothetical protein
MPVVEAASHCAVSVMFSVTGVLKSYVVLPLYQPAKV